MKKRHTVDRPDAADLDALFENAPLANDANEALAVAMTDLKADPELVSDYLKGQFIEDILKAMEAQGLNKNQLAQKLGKSRQYLGRVLNEKGNFTFETLALFACALDMRVEARLYTKTERMCILPAISRPPLHVLDQAEHKKARKKASAKKPVKRSASRH